jgi:MarR family transcriptional regulator, negative regulator of the multidrug operon emrRAB
MGDEDRRDNLVGAFVLEIADRIRQATEAAIGHSGATAAGLVTIAQFPDGTVEDLRKAIGLSHPATVRVVDRLVAEKLVRRRPADRGPAVALTVTGAGRRKARAILDVRREVLRGALPELSPHEEVTLATILEKALANLADAPDPTLCRLCDKARCRRADCPVVHAQTERGNPPPEFVPLD